MKAKTKLSRVSQVRLLLPQGTCSSLWQNSRVLQSTCVWDVHCIFFLKNEVCTSWFSVKEITTKQGYTSMKITNPKSTLKKKLIFFPVVFLSPMWNQRVGTRTYCLDSSHNNFIKLFKCITKTVVVLYCNLNVLSPFLIEDCNLNVLNPFLIED